METTEQALARLNAAYKAKVESLQAEARDWMETVLAAEARKAQVAAQAQSQNLKLAAGKTGRIGGKNVR
jgi:plasmid stability protein